MGHRGGGDAQFLRRSRKARVPRRRLERLQRIKRRQALARGGDGYENRSKWIKVFCFFFSKKKALLFEKRSKNFLSV